MLFSSKNNKTNNATVNTSEETQETTNNGGGLLTTMAIAGGTILGITAAVIGGKKLYKHFHDDDETFDSDDDFNEFEEDEDDEPAHVENFKEVETEVTVNETPAEDKASKAEEPVNETPVEAEEANTEKPENPAPAKAEEPVVETPAEVKETEAEETENKAPVEVKETKTEETKETETMQLEKLIEKAVSAVPYDKPETVDLTYYVRCMGGYLNKINMDEAGNTGRFVIAEQCLAMTDLVSRAIIHIGSANIDNLDMVRGAYVDIKRMANEFKASHIMDFTQKPELCKEKFEDTLNMVAHNLSLTKSILKLKEAKPADSKSSTGENQTANKAKGETKTSTKASDENKKLMKLIHKCNEELPIMHPERADICHSIRCMDSYIKKIDKTSLSKDELRELMDECDDMTRSVTKAIGHIGGECYDNIKDVHKAARKINEISKEFIDSGIMDTTINPSSAKKYFDRRVRRSLERLDDTKNDLALESENRSAKNTAGEIKTAEPVVDEKQATTKESPSETQIGNSTVISDNSETVTLTAEVSQESINNVNEVIDIVSKIPNQDQPEMNDMPYFIRVIGGRIHGITEPEATFIAYDEASNSNKFIDACTDICNMTGKAICNLANSGKNPLASMQWIDRCVNELVASGIIDNTYDPNAYRSAILKAHGEAMDKLSKMVSGETKTDTDKVTDETQADDKSSSETQTEETLTYTMSEKIQEAVQQSDETAATAAPEPDSQAPMSPEASSLASKLQEVGNLMRAEKWSEAAEFYKTQLTPYLADDGLSKELRDEIMGIKTKATNMLMSQKQLEAKQKAASAKASKKASKKRRRH